MSLIKLAKPWIRRMIEEATQNPNFLSNVGKQYPGVAKDMAISGNTTPNYIAQLLEQNSLVKNRIVRTLGSRIQGQVDSRKAIQSSPLKGPTKSVILKPGDMFEGRKLRPNEVLAANMKLKQQASTGSGPKPFSPEFQAKAKSYINDRYSGDGRSMAKWDQGARGAVPEVVYNPLQDTGRSINDPSLVSPSTRIFKGSRYPENKKPGELTNFFASSQPNIAAGYGDQHISVLRPRDITGGLPGFNEQGVQIIRPDQNFFSPRLMRTTAPERMAEMERLVKNKTYSPDTFNTPLSQWRTPQTWHPFEHGVKRNDTILDRNPGYETVVGGLTRPMRSTAGVMPNGNLGLRTRKRHVEPQLNQEVAKWNTPMQQHPSI